MKTAGRIFAMILALVLFVSSFSVSVFSVDYVSAGTKGDTGASESFMAGKYYTYFSDVSLTGDNPTDVLAIALSQLGYTEGNSPDSFSGTVSGKKNFTEYNYNFGIFDKSTGYGYHWCASFVSFCLLQAGVHEYNTLDDWCREHTYDKNYIWRELGCEKWRLSLVEHGYFKTSAYYAKDDRLNFSASYDTEYIPSPADLIFFTEDMHRRATHIGFVLYVDGDTVYTIEGNTDPQSELETDGDGVYVKSYKLNDMYIIGFGDMPYSTDDSVQKPDYSGKGKTVGLYMSKSDIPLYMTRDALSEQRITGTAHTIKAHTMFYVKEIISEDALLVDFAVGSEVVSGYINGDGVSVQLSVGESELHIPPEDSAEDSGGCKNAGMISAICVISAVCASAIAIGAWFAVRAIRKKKNI